MAHLLPARWALSTWSYFKMPLRSSYVRQSESRGAFKKLKMDVLKGEEGMGALGFDQLFAVCR